jgi:hypothetical protein
MLSQAKINGGKPTAVEVPPDTDPDMVRVFFDGGAKVIRTQRGQRRRRRNPRLRRILTTNDQSDDRVRNARVQATLRGPAPRS